MWMVSSSYRGSEESDHGRVHVNFDDTLERTVETMGDDGDTNCTCARAWIEVQWVFFDFFARKEKKFRNRVSTGGRWL